MKLFLYENLATVSDHWHSGGSILVVAEDISMVQKIVNDTSEHVVLDKSPSLVLNIESDKQFAKIFLNVGCC